MRAFITGTALALVLAISSTAVSAQNSNQPQPQIDTPQKADQPIDHEKERAKQGPNPAQMQGDKGSVPGRTPETGQAMGMPPNNPDTTEARDVGTLPGVSPQTIPAKYSAEVYAKDQIKTTQRQLALTPEQKRLIVQRIGADSATKGTASTGVFAEPGLLLPADVTPSEFPQDLQANIPALNGLKYVKKDEQVLLVMPSNGIVRSVLQ
jgi:hypothetical protein